MNFTANFKRQMLFVALGASLLLAGRASGQEIVNTDFATPAPSVGSNFNSADPQAVATPTTALVARASNEMDQLSAASLPREAASVIAIAIVLLGCAVAKKVADNRRKESTSKWNSTSPRKAVSPEKYYPLHG